MRKILFGVVFIGLFVSAASDCMADRPRSRSAEGVIEKIDIESGAITIRSANKTEIFILHEWARLLQSNDPVSMERLKVGAPVNYWYRKPLFGDKFVTKIAW